VSDLNSMMEMLEVPQDIIDDIIETEKSAEIPEKQFEIIIPDITRAYSLFDIDKFTKELQEKSAAKNQAYRELFQNINAYDLANNCIRDIVYKLLNTPVESFADKWLPVLLRSTLGNAIHNFIQDNSNQFTEREVSIKIPSKRVSVRLDNLIGPNILVEIKSLPYSEYEKIVKSCKPRIADFYQAVAYKYFLENFLEEAKNSGEKTRTPPPALNNYDIQQIQFIYVAHDVVANDVESLAEILERIKQLKRLLNSKSNTFFFMTTLAIDVTNNIADPYINYIKNKLERINHYLDSGKIPPNDDEFVDTGKCFFCLYKKLCNQNKR